MTSRLVVVSNRVPERIKGKPTNVGGLVSALRPALAGRDAIWFGWSGRTSERAPGPTGRIDRIGDLHVIATDLSRAEAEEYYEGFCNKALWPITHSFLRECRIERAHYRRYRSVNARFARLVARCLRHRHEDRVWAHDFHTIPLGRELRKCGFEGPLGFFLHVPFPARESLEVLPWADELLEDLLAYDVVGFHTRDYAWNYVQAVGRVPGAGERPRQHVGVYPIGIDPLPYEEWAEKPLALARGDKLRGEIGGRKLLLGVDRLDYTKGILDRLRTFEKLLEVAPRWRRNVTLLQISAPSRIHVEEYRRQRRAIEELVGAINGRQGEPGWVPVQYIFKAFTPEELAAYYREADVALVTPLRDGMNLVAKEFVAAQTGDPGVLVLSQFAGAAEELREAVIVNPYDHEGTARAISKALSMPLAARALRQSALLGHVRRQSAERWADAFLADLDHFGPSRASLVGASPDLVEY